MTCDIGDLEPDDTGILTVVVQYDQITTIPQNGLVVLARSHIATTSPESTQADNIAQNQFVITYSNSAVIQ